MKTLSALVLTLCFGFNRAIAIDDGGPVNHGEEVTIDLPTSQKKPNISASGLGCCVFRSLDYAAHYQNVPALYDFPEWMVQHGVPGGGYPSKVDDLIPRIARDRGLPVPDYVQHTGGDMEFLKLALRTGRMVCTTYDGRDTFYRGTISHMVSLIHLSEKWAVIADNNTVNSLRWMTPEEFRSRWIGGGGGWAVVLLNSPPSPIPHNKVPNMQSLLLMATMFASGQSCPNCKQMQPVEQVYHGWYEAGFGMAELWWKGEKVGVLNLNDRSWKTDGKDTAVNLEEQFGPRVVGAVPVGNLCNCGGKRQPCNCYPCNGKACDGDCPCWKNDCGKKALPKECICEKGDCKCNKCPNDCVASQLAFGATVGDDPFPGGVDSDKVATAPEYICNGKACTKQSAYIALAGGQLTDDSTKRTLTIVADTATIKKVLSDLETHPGLSQLKGKFHVNAYTPDHWVVQQVGLAPGISFQEAPDRLGKAPVIWRFRSYAGPDALAQAIRKVDPNYNPENDPDPMKPTQKPVPVVPDIPDGKSDGKIDATKPTPAHYFGLAAFVAAIGLGGLHIRKSIKGK